MGHVVIRGRSLIFEMFSDLFYTSVGRLLGAGGTPVAFKYGLQASGQKLLM